MRKNAPYDDNVRPSLTDRWTNIIAIAQRLVLTNASRANIKYQQEQKQQCIKAIMKS